MSTVTCPNCGKENDRSNEYCRGEYCKKPIRGDMISYRDKEEFLKFIHHLEEGDKILWNHRKEPLTVTHVGEIEGNDDSSISLGVESQRGTSYWVTQSTKQENYFTASSMGSITSDPEHIRWIKEA